MKLIWTNEALEQLAGIEDYISKDSPERAVMFVEQIINYAEKALPDKPRKGRIVPEIANPDIRELIFKKYRIVYRINERRIDILTVFESHRLLRRDEIDL
ncbi:MAG: type II toxin-antitoxin system RelE/ParE family toxin [Candidatus Schekmanbacteria bacterium]|nr:type II toxin-antitoxin system RelE/ParE family toxin [Candidatus Schekmanbacteria bacterium]